MVLFYGRDRELGQRVGLWSTVEARGMDDDLR